MNLKIAVLSDGIGPEVILQAKKALCHRGCVQPWFVLKILVVLFAINKTGSPPNRTNVKPMYQYRCSVVWSYR
jgi:isocitrate/isopropylmalate dehydrogenase